MKRLIIFVSILFFTYNGIFAQTTSKPFSATVESLRQYSCPEWFRDAKLGIWSHWGAQTVPMHQNGWYARDMYIEGTETYKYHLANYGHPSKFGFKDIIPLWKAEKFDPNQLMQLYKDAGAKYFIALATHHDNFDLWDSKYQPRWNSVNMGPKKNIVKMWQDAALKQGLRFGITTHLERTWSWYQVNKGADKTGPYAGVPYDGNDPAFQDLYLKPDSTGDNNKRHPLNAPIEWRKHWLSRIEDVIEKYHPDLMYVDGAVPFLGDDQGQTGLEMMAYLYNTNASVHKGRNEAVMCVKKISNHGMYWDGISTLDMERTKLNDIAPEPWNMDNSTGPWFYNLDWKDRETGTMYYSARKIITDLVDVVSKNGCMMLNVTQLPDGSIDTTAVRLLREIGEWTKVNGEAIYATRPWKIYGESKETKPLATKELKDLAGARADDVVKYSTNDIRYTQSKDAKILYAFAMSKPISGKVIMKSLNTEAGKIKSLTMLGYKGKIGWKQTAEGLIISFPDTLPCNYVYSFRIVGKGLCKPVNN